MDTQPQPLDELLAQMSEFRAQQQASFLEPRYASAVAFSAAEISPADGRRWLDRGIIKPDDTGGPRTKFRFSAKTVLSLAIMSRVVRLGLSPAEGFEVGEKCAESFARNLGQVFALAVNDRGGRGLFMHVARDKFGQIAIERTPQPLPPPLDFPAASILLDISAIASATASGLGMMVVFGGAAELRAAADSAVIEGRAPT